MNFYIESGGNAIDKLNGGVALAALKFAQVRIIYACFYSGCV